MKRPEPALDGVPPQGGDDGAAVPHRRVARACRRAEPEAAKRRRYVERIRAALLDPNGPDQAHAMEALGEASRAAVDDNEQRNASARWPKAKARRRRSRSGAWPGRKTRPRSISWLRLLLRRRDDARLRRVRAGPSSAAARFRTQRGVATLKNEPDDSPARTMLRTALGGDAVGELACDIKVAPSGRYFAAMSLAETGTAGDLPILRPTARRPGCGRSRRRRIRDAADRVAGRNNEALPR